MPRITQLQKITKIIMKRGEGAAIVNAGTAKVSAVLRSTSRKIKNSL